MERAVNQFQKGLYTDYHPLTVQPDMLTDCLNGTIITNNGNEFMLQNDMGNVRVESARLPAGYVPIGTAELGGIVYVVSYNPFTKKCQIGSFPSPKSNFTQDEINDSNIQLDTEKYYESSNGSFPFSQNQILKTNVTKLILLDTLKVGEKYKVFSQDLMDFINNDYISGVCINENNLNIHNNPRYLKLILVSIAENGKITYIDDLVWDKITVNTKDAYYYIKPEALNLKNGKINLEEYRNLIDSNYNIASYKGFVTLGILAQLECIDTFNVTWDALISDEVDNDGKKTNNKKAQLYWYLNWTYDNPIEESRNRVNPYSIYISDTDVNAKETESRSSNIEYPYIRINEEGEEEKNVTNPDARKDCAYCIPKEIDIVEYPKLIQKKEQEGLESLYDFTQKRKNDGSDPEFILPHYKPLTYNPNPTNTERHNFDIIPRMPFGQMEWLKQSISLDLVKLGSGATDLIRWKYYKDEVGSTISLYWGLEAYPERNKKIKSVTLSFKKFNEHFANISKIIDGYKKEDPDYSDSMEYNEKIGMFKIQKNGNQFSLSEDVFKYKSNTNFVPEYFYPKENEKDTRDVDYEIEYKDLPSYSGLFTAKIPLTVTLNEDSFEGEKAKTLDSDSVYLCQILINYNDEEYRVYYRFLFTSTIFNKEYFNEDKLDYKDLTLTDYLNVNLGLSFDKGYPKISEDDDNNPDRITKVVSNKTDAINTGMDKVPTYQMTRGIREFYIKDYAKLIAQFKYNITSDIPSLTFDLKEKPEIELSEYSYTQNSDYDMISSDLLLETPVESTFRDLGESSNNEDIKSTIEVNTTVPYRVLYNKSTTLSNLVELQNLIIYNNKLYDASWRTESKMWLNDNIYNKENPQLQVGDHGNQMVSFHTAFGGSLNRWFKNNKADIISLKSHCETETNGSEIYLSEVNIRNLSLLSSRPPQGDNEDRIRIFVFRSKDNICTGLIYINVSRDKDNVLYPYKKSASGELLENYLKSLKKYVTLDEIIEVFESEHINYYNNPKVKIPWKIETQGYSSDSESTNNYIKFKKVENVSIESNSALPKNLIYIDKNTRTIKLNYYFTIPTYPIFLASLYTDQSEVYEVIERDLVDDSIQDIRPLTNNAYKIYDSKNRILEGFHDKFYHQYFGISSREPLNIIMGGNFERNQYTKQLSFKQTRRNVDLGYRFVGETNGGADQVIQLNNLMLITPDTQLTLKDSTTGDVITIIDPDSKQERLPTIREELKEIKSNS